MNIQHKNIFDKLHSWLTKLPNSTDNHFIIEILALIRICKMNTYFSGEELNQIAYKFLNKVTSIKYDKGSLLMSILACDLVLELGNELQIQNAKSYFSLLKTVKEQNVSRRNEAILKTTFSNVKSTEKLKMRIRIDHLTKNIDQSITNILENIESKSCFGKIKTQTDDFSVLQVEAMSIRAQRSLNIELAMRCLRARNYLSKSNSLIMKTSLDFIEFQQCYDGSFGDYESDIKDFKNITEKHQLLLKIKTIVTFQVIWTLNELDGKYLFSSLYLLKTKPKKYVNSRTNTIF